jgi:DNA-binding XRE family transcriptional regulator
LKAKEVKILNNEVLKQLRKSNKFSQEEMARTLDISLRAYQLKEKGQNEFLFSEVIKLAEKFNISLMDFINRVV